ncbi:hypothetical protein PIB30_110869, partial [Stylosanthes scabra]|nr:hypothetical protein [Stylosanthes scabra]
CHFSPLSTPPSLHPPRRQKRGSGGGTGEEERNDSGERRRIRRKVPTSRKWRRRERRLVIRKKGKDASPILEAETRAGSRRTTRGWIVGSKVVGKQFCSTFGRKRFG